MENAVKDLLIINSLGLDGLIEEYRVFFLALLPGMFVFATLVEYFDRLNLGALLRRGLIAVMILASVTGVYKTTIDYSIDAANEKLTDQKGKNILLMNMFSAAGMWSKFNSNKEKHSFYKDKGIFSGSVAFFKYHFFDKHVNDVFTISVYFISQLCFLILKVVYSLVYYLGYGLIGVACIIYLFPTMGNVLRGAVISFVWCLVVPHVLVFILTLVGSEISKGYVAGQVIGGTLMGTALLFLMTLFIAFTPIITAMILNGSGIAQAGSLIATIGGNWVMNLPSKGATAAAAVLTGGAIGPKTKLALGAAKFGMDKTSKVSSLFRGSSSTKSGQSNTGKTNNQASNKNRGDSSSRDSHTSNSTRSSRNSSLSRNSNQSSNSLSSDSRHKNQFERSSSNQNVNNQRRGISQKNSVASERKTNVRRNDNEKIRRSNQAARRYKKVRR